MTFTSKLQFYSVFANVNMSFVHRKLTESFFPKVTNSTNKIKIYELFTIHLGLVNPHLQLEHSRRLIATISDEMISNNLFDLL